MPRDAVRPLSIHPHKSRSRRHSHAHSRYEAPHHSQACDTSSLSTPPVLQTVAATVTTAHPERGASGDEAGATERFRYSQVVNDNPYPKGTTGCPMEKGEEGAVAPSCAKLAFQKRYEKPAPAAL